MKLELAEVCLNFSFFLGTESNSGEGQGAGGTYSAVGFSYGNSDVSADQKNSNSVVGDYGFRPPFPVPENLLQSLVSELHLISLHTVLKLLLYGARNNIKSAPVKLTDQST